MTKKTLKPQGGSGDERGRSRSPAEREPHPDTGTLTERSIERDREDDTYVPVIVKRTDEAVRHPDDILEKAILEGLEQIERPFLSLSLSSIAAGLILGFTAMPVAIVSTQLSTMSDPFNMRLLSALVYPFGFIICIMSGTQLFTEHTAIAVYPFLEGRSGLAGLLRLWFLVLIGNILGALVVAGLLTLGDEVIQAEKGYLLIARHLVGYGSGAIIISAVLAGWLMALGGWLVLATPPNISQMACIYAVTFLIGIGGLHHSIAGSVEIFTALLLGDQFTCLQAGRFIGLAIIGNLLGGSIFVAVLNYSYIRKTQEISR